MIFMEFTIAQDPDRRRLLCDLTKVRLHEWSGNTTKIAFGPNDAVIVEGSYDEIKKQLNQAIGGEYDE